MNKIKDAIYMPGSYVYNYHYHLIWVTKYRHQIFNTKEQQEYLLELLKRIAKLNDITIQYSEVMNGHVHLLITFMNKLANLILSILIISIP